MSLNPGSVTIAADGSITGTGLALAICDAILADASPVGRRNSAALVGPFSERLAAAIITHITEHGVVTVTVRTTDAGLQRDPSDETPTLAPAENKTLPGSLT